MISGLTVRDEIEMSSNYMQQQSANVHSINSTVSKESAFGRQFFLMNASETAVTPTCIEFGKLAITSKFPNVSFEMLLVLT